MYIHKLKCEKDQPDGFLRFYGPCVVTGETYSVLVKKEELLLYIKGELAQYAFPNLSSDDREFLISGTSPKGWKQLFE